MQSDGSYKVYILFIDKESGKQYQDVCGVQCRISSKLSDTLEYNCSMYEMKLLPIWIQTVNKTNHEHRPNGYMFEVIQYEFFQSAKSGVENTQCVFFRYSVKSILSVCALEASSFHITLV